MKNEFGEVLDRNGYAPSIIYQTGGCYICGRTDRALQRHEIFHGPYREKSKKLGLWVNLCDLCHDTLHHKGEGLDAQLKETGQMFAEYFYGWTTEDFRYRFGKNYKEEI